MTDPHYIPKTKANIVLDSITPEGVRLTTLSLVYPRFVHSEFMTHRVFSRNAMSSRAVPVAKMIEQVRLYPAMPIHWGANQPGMQANDEVGDDAKQSAQWLWRKSALDAVQNAESMAALGLHKQVVNRILEPYQWMHTIVTATEWDNFFMLRRDHGAEPNIQLLANTMFDAMEHSTPVERERHIPYVDESELRDIGDIMEACMVSAARCARVSYLNHDGSFPQLAKDKALANTLYESKHASPFEHQAFAAPAIMWSRNFRGWTQFRSVLAL